MPRTSQSTRLSVVCGQVMVAALAAWQASACWAVEFSALASYLPPGANAVVTVNAAEIYASPLAKRENWHVKYADAFEAAPLLLPPNARQCILAAKLDLKSFNRTWEAAAMTTAVNPTAEQIAKRRGGRADSVAGLEAVWLPPKLCVVKFAPSTFALLNPATPEEANRWARQAKAGGGGGLSPYLREAAGFADSRGTEVILAVDLANTFQESNIRAVVAQAELLKDMPSEQVVKILASVRGVKLGVLVGERLEARLQLDFTEDVGPLAKVAKPLLLGILGKAGAMLEEFNGWTGEAAGKNIAIKGELSTDGMRRLFSLLAINAAEIDGEPPRDAPGEAPSAAAPSPAAPNPAAQASLRYFRGLSKYVDDAQRLNRADSLGQAVMWIDNYARKIDALPTRNVDPELIQYADYVGQTFRAIVSQAAGLEQQAVDASSQPAAATQLRIGLLPTSNVINYGGYREREFAPYGYAQVDEAAIAQARQRTADDIYKAVEAARQTLTKLVADHETVRKNLSQRYGIAF